MTIYYQWKQGLLDNEIYETWLDELTFTINHHDIDFIMTRVQTLFPGKRA